VLAPDDEVADDFTVEDPRELVRVFPEGHITTRGTEHRFTSQDPRQSKGGQRRWAAERFKQALAAIPDLPDSDFKPYSLLARTFAANFMRDLKVIGNHTDVGVGAASIVGTAAFQLAQAHWWQDKAAVETNPELRAAHFDRANRAASASRQAVATATDLARKANAVSPVSRPTKLSHASKFRRTAK
jgi:hypothetical protein